ncbi:MAG: transposase [Candidatus Hodarchaeota archaeon]
MIEKAEKILGDGCIKKVYIDRGSYSIDNFAYLKDKNIDFLTKGKSNTRFYKEAKEIPDDEYEEILFEEDYVPKTERGKMSQKERMKSKKPKLFAEREVNFTKNGKNYTMRMIVQKKITDLSKRDKLILLLNEQKTTKTAAELLKLYEEEYKEPFSKSKNPTESMRATLLNIRQLSRDIVPKEKGSKQKVYKFQLKDKIAISTIEANTKKLIFKIWLTTINGLTKKEIRLKYKKRWRVELFFKEEKWEWSLNNFPSKKFDAVKTFIYFKFIAYLIIAVFKLGLTEKYKNSGIDRLKLYIIEKVGFIRTKDDHIEIELYGESYIERMDEQMQSMKDYFAGLGYD